MCGHVFGAPKPASVLKGAAVDIAVVIKLCSNVLLLDVVLCVGTRWAIAVGTRFWSTYAAVDTRATRLEGMSIR